jgi:hypothetical protein
VIPTPDKALPPESSGTTLAITAGIADNGITTINGKLIIVQSATGILFRIDPTTGAATPIDLGGYLVTSGRLVGELTNPNFDIPSTAALQGGRLWAVNARFGTAVPPDTSSFAANSVKPLGSESDDDDADDDDDDNDNDDDRD